MDKKIKVATALKYKSDDQVAPKLVAKGKGVIAENIIKKAEESDIVTYEDEHLSQQLYNLSIGDTIPEELYHVVARVLAFVAELDQAQNKF
ncbi:MAG: EscU/YscU/HrcU family type III secretion system export apparatus switch protein [Clostridiales bacterium]|nr:EscU/YscU/HrcU family type III secretion system export apparatus switch protein [Clostridiales bacterium]